MTTGKSCRGSPEDFMLYWILAIAENMAVVKQHFEAVFNTCLKFVPVFQGVDTYV
jgi:hypothetical protein